ncbi:MAG: cob(I)yrinic acid a,c-diamide adenosyltransferase [Turicibacter sp.]|nr:cob(I)yrinic acid a,c-diamide adenosyltransferase [Turicibacter sp.]
MKLYTKSGDEGMTSLLGGKRTLKTDLRIIANGTLDELGAFIGLARSMAPAPLAVELGTILQDLFEVGYDLSLCPGNGPFKTAKEKIAGLEEKIDGLAKKLPTKFLFVLASDDGLASHLNVARAVCRRAERDVVALREAFPINGFCLMYLNRLSDYLFAACRAYGKGELFYEA